MNGYSGAKTAWKAGEATVPSLPAAIIFLLRNIGASLDIRLIPWEPDQDLEVITAFTVVVGAVWGVFVGIRNWAKNRDRGAPGVDGLVALAVMCGSLLMGSVGCATVADRLGMTPEEARAAVELGLRFLDAYEAQRAEIEADTAEHARQQQALKAAAVAGALEYRAARRDGATHKEAEAAALEAAELTAWSLGYSLPDIAASVLDRDRPERLRTTDLLIGVIRAELERTESGS